MSKMTLLPPWRNPLYFLVNDKDYTHSTIVAITGPKRSGKSLLLARLLYHDMVLHNRVVWSTMPVKTPSFMLEKGYPLQTSKDIDWDSLYMLSEEYTEGTVGLDESIYFDDSRTSLSMRNKLLNTIMNQVGHRNLNVYYTVKSQGWLDRRLVFETDLEIKCFDLGMSPWGRENHLGRGKMIRLDMFDKSGAFTGREYNEKTNFRPFKVIIWKNADKWWDCYNTKALVGLEELHTKVKVDFKQRVITNKQSIGNDIQVALCDLVSGLKDNGNERISCDKFWGMAERMGIEGDSRQLGRYLKPLNVSRKVSRQGNYYDLSSFQKDSLE